MDKRQAQDIDPRLLSVLGLSQGSSAADAAIRLASMAGAEAPNDEETLRLWSSLAMAIQEQLLQSGEDAFEDAEAAHYVIMGLFGPLPSDEERRQAKLEEWKIFERSFRGDNPNERLSDFVAHEIAPRLAAAGHFKLI